MYPPSLHEEGSGGTYIVRSVDSRNIAVFKPMDEEPGAPNNPKQINGAVLFRKHVIIYRLLFKIRVCSRRRCFQRSGCLLA